MCEDLGRLLKPYVGEDQSLEKRGQNSCISNFTHTRIKLELFESKFLVSKEKGPPSTCNFYCLTKAC